MAKRAVKCINAMTPRPRFVVVCGDLVHAYPWQKPAYGRQVTARARDGALTVHAHQPALVFQVQDFKRVMARIDPSIPLVCLCGNHGLYLSPSSALGPRVTVRYPLHNKTWATHLREPQYSATRNTLAMTTSAFGLEEYVG